MSRLLSLAYGRAKKKFTAVLASASLAIGGLTLLLHALSIGHLPDFSWNDLFGTFLAVCATGILIAVTLILYCLCAGFAGRWALEQIYPDAASLKDDSKIEVGDFAYGRLLRGPFVLGATCLSLLVWAAVLVDLSSSKLTSPYNERLWSALILSLLAISVLIFADWPRFATKVWRNVFLSVLIGSVTTVAVIIAAWSIGPNTLAVKLDAASKNSAAFDWASLAVWAIDHSLMAGFITAGIALGLAYSRSLINNIRRFLRSVMSSIPETIRARIRRLAKPAAHVVGSHKEDIRLVWAKVIVAATFCGSSGLVLLAAYTMAGIGSRQDWVKNFLLISLMLAFLNCASFSIREWKGRALLGLATAGVMLLSFPIFARNPLMFSNLVVSMLGLGNERLATLALAGRQCAALEPYGMTCPEKEGQSITLIDVNLLSRLGNSVVFELLIEDRPKPTAPKVNIEPAGRKIDVGQEIANEVTLKSMKHMGHESAAAKSCAPLLLDQLDTSDLVRADDLRCVQLIVPKDQVLSYTKSQSRNYRGNYSGYTRLTVTP